MNDKKYEEYRNLLSDEFMGEVCGCIELAEDMDDVRKD